MPSALRSLRRLVVSAVILSLAAGRATAQQPVPLPPVTLNGVVVDATRRGIPDVEVSIPVLQLLVKTDSMGRFHFADIAPDAYYVRARRIGFRPVDSRYQATATSRPVAIIMMPIDVTLDTVVVREKCQPRGYAGFVCRSNAGGGGAFLDAAAIDSTKAIQVGDLFNDRKHFRVTVTPRTGTKVPSLSDRTCLTTLVDGIPAGRTNPTPLYARQIVGVEIYERPMDAPKAYETYTWKGPSPCGLIVYWTSRNR